MFNNYSWKSTYLKQGMISLNDFSYKTLRSVQVKYSKDYLSFLDKLTDSYDISNSDVGAFAYDLTRKIKTAISLIGRVLGSKGRRATKSEVDELYSIMNEITEGISSLGGYTSSDEELQATLENIELQTNINIEDLDNTQKAIKDALKDIKIERRGGIANILKAGALGPYTAAKELGRAALNSTFGYGTVGLGSTALGSLKGVRNAYKGYKKTRKESQLIEGLTLSSRTGMLDDETGFSGIHKRSESRFGGRIFSGEGGDAGTFSGGELSIRSDVAGGMFDFWNSGAFRAKYTRILFKSILGGGGSGSGIDGPSFAEIASGSLFFGAAGANLGKLAKLILSGLLAAGPIALLAGTIYLTSKAIKDEWGKDLADFVENTLGNEDKNNVVNVEAAKNIMSGNPEDALIITSGLGSMGDAKIAKKALDQKKRRDELINLYGEEAFAKMSPETRERLFKNNILYGYSEDSNISSNQAHIIPDISDPRHNPFLNPHINPISDPNNPTKYEQYLKLMEELKEESKKQTDEIKKINSNKEIPPVSFNVTNSTVAMLATDSYTVGA